MANSEEVKKGAEKDPEPVVPNSASIYEGKITAQIAAKILEIEKGLRAKRQNSDGWAQTTLKVLLGTLSLVFLLVLIVFFVLEIFYRFFPGTLFEIGTYHFGVLNESIASSTLNSSANVDVSGMIIGIIGLFSLFGAVLAYVFNNVVSANILKITKDEIHKLATQERIASRVETWTSVSYILGELSDELKKPIFLDNALGLDKQSFIKIQRLDQESLGCTVFNAKNNYAYNLAVKQTLLTEKGESIDAFDRLIALRLRDELREAISSGKVYKIEGITEKYVEEWIDTCEKIDEIFGK